MCPNLEQKKIKEKLRTYTRFQDSCKFALVKAMWHVNEERHTDYRNKLESQSDEENNNYKEKLF